MESTAAKILLPVEDEIQYIYKTHDKNGKPYRRDGQPRRFAINNKKKGKSSKVRHFNPEDLRAMNKYFKEHEYWCHYLAFVLTCNTARRIGDILPLKWDKLYNPTTGKVRNYLEIVEEKTGKISETFLNSSCRKAIKLYVEKTGYNPAAFNYNAFVFVQPTGTHKGKVLSYSGYDDGLKRAAETIGIEYRIGTHSARKTFGAMTRRLHPNDSDSLQLLQEIFKHSSEETTLRYIGLTQEKEDAYLDDYGRYFDDYVEGDGIFIPQKADPVMTFTTNDVRELIKQCYERGYKDCKKANDNPTASMDAMNDLMALAEGLEW